MEVRGTSWGMMMRSGGKRWLVPNSAPSKPRTEEWSGAGRNRDFEASKDFRRKKVGQSLRDRIPACFTCHFVFLFRLFIPFPFYRYSRHLHVTPKCKAPTLI